jgi:hypothetical protein
VWTPESLDGFPVSLSNTFCMGKRVAITATIFMSDKMELWNDKDGARIRRSQWLHIETFLKVDGVLACYVVRENYFFDILHLGESI